jgi:heterodisulfide reductase subunit C
MSQIQPADIQGKVTRKQFEELSGEKISTCYQCEKCSNGCPMTFAMDIAPCYAFDLFGKCR